MKRNARVLALFLTISFLCDEARAGNTEAYGFPPMASNYLNRVLIGALHSMGCTVGSNEGVSGDSRHQNGAPTSCHNVARAIDISSLDCENDKSNEENLRTLASYFSFNPFILICYKEIGPLFTRCRGDHGSHLHFGAREGLRCTSPLPF